MMYDTDIEVEYKGVTFFVLYNYSVYPSDKPCPHHPEVEQGLVTRRKITDVGEIINCETEETIQDLCLRSRIINRAMKLIQKPTCPMCQMFS